MPVVHQHRLALRQLAGLLVGRGQCAGLDLGRLHVGLVEGVDAHHRAGHGGGDLPGKELAEDLVEVGNLDVDDRMPGGLKRRDLGVLRLCVRRARIADVCEDPVVAIDRRRGRSPRGQRA